MTLIVAVIAAAVVGSLLFPYRRYRFWWKWSRRIFLIALVLIVVVNALVGLVGVVVAHTVNWTPWEEEWRNGISFAMLGLALVRVRLPGLDIDKPESSIYALNVVMKWIVEWLDGVADETILKTLATLTDRELRELVSYVLTKEVIPDQSVDSQDRAEDVRKMAEAARRLQAGNRDAWAEMLAWSVLQTRRRLLRIDRLRPPTAAGASASRG